MKKTILSIAIIFGIISSSVYASDSKLSDDDKKKTEAIAKFKSDCTQSMLESGSGLDEDTAGKLCGCVAENAGKIFTTEELEALNNEQYDNLPQEKIQKLQESIQECAMSMQ